MNNKNKNNCKDKAPNKILQDVPSQEETCEMPAACDFKKKYEDANKHCEDLSEEVEELSKEVQELTEQVEELQEEIDDENCKKLTQNTDTNEEKVRELTEKIRDLQRKALENEGFIYDYFGKNFTSTNIKNIAMALVMLSGAYYVVSSKTGISTLRNEIHNIAIDNDLKTRSSHAKEIHEAYVKGNRYSVLEKENEMYRETLVSLIIDKKLEVSSQIASFLKRKLNWVLGTVDTKQYKEETLTPYCIAIRKIK